MLVRWDEWTLDVPARRLVGGDGAIHVEPQVFDVLAYLVAHRDRVVGKAELLDNIWGDQFVSESALTSRIKSVRRALGDDGKTQRYIRNVHGRGYQFVGQLSDDGVGSRASHGSADPRGVAPGARGASDLAGAIAVDDEFPFVGREDELKLIDTELAGANRGLIALGGEPGIGKSRLAIEVLQRAVERGVLVCAGRCEEHVRYPLQPILDATSELAEQRPESFAVWASGLEPQLVALVPGLVGVFDVDPSPVDGYAALDVLATVVERAASETPLILLVDDLHWSDDPTRSLLARVVRRLRGRQFAVIATFRSTALDLPIDVRRWIDEQMRAARGLRLDLAELSVHAARELVGRVVPDRAAADAEGLLAATGGHGLFLTEALRDLHMGRSGGGGSVQDVVVARAALLSANALALVRAGSALGSEFPYELAVAGAALDAAGALHAVDEAISAGLLYETESPSRFRFSHQLVADAIRVAMPSILVAGIHERCAASLLSTGGDEVDIAHHLLGAVPLVALDEAVRRSRAAAADALARHQFERGERLLDQVLALPIGDRTRGEVLVEVGFVMLAAGRTVSAVPRFEEAAALARSHGWTDVLADAALGHLGRSPYRRLLDTSTLDLLREADAALGDRPTLRKAKVLAKTAVFSQFVLPLADCDAMARRALAMVPEAAERDRIDLLEARAILLNCPIGMDEYEAVYGELAGLLARHHVLEADAATAETIYYARGRGAELREVARMVERRAEGHAISEWRDLTLAAMLAAFLGDLDVARQRYEESGSIGEQYWGDSAHVLNGLGHLFLGALGGGWDRACELFEPLLLFDRNQHLIAPAAWAHLAAGNGGRGRELAGEIRIESLRWHGEHILGGNTLIAIAEVAMLTDDDALAAAVEPELERFPHLMLGLPWACSLAASHALARLARRRGDDVVADRHAASATDLYERLGAPALGDLLGRSS